MARMECPWHPLDIVDIKLSFVTELESEFAFFVSEGICLIDLGILWQFSIGFHWNQQGSDQTNENGMMKGHTTSSFVGGVLDNDICFVILEIPERK